MEFASTISWPNIVAVATIAFEFVMSQLPAFSVSPEVTATDITVKSAFGIFLNAYSSCAQY